MLRTCQSGPTAVVKFCHEDYSYGIALPEQRYTVCILYCLLIETEQKNTDQLISVNLRDNISETGKTHNEAGRRLLLLNLFVGNRIKRRRTDDKQRQ